MTDTDRAVDALVRGAVDNGFLIEAGWIAMRFMVLPPDAGAAQVADMRKAFFAGAQHLWASIQGGLDPGSEPTDADLRRMSNIDEELRGFVTAMKREMYGTGDPST